MSKKNYWTCSACGMSSGRRYSLKRHIDNKNIHAGEGRIMPTPEYLAGVNSGLYNPSLDSLVNTQSRIMSEHLTPMQKKNRQKADGTANNMIDSQAGEGTKIYYRKIIERIAEHDADEMIKNWEGKPGEYKLAETALNLRQYEDALAGKLDWAAEIEKVVAATQEMKLLLDLASIVNNSRSKSAATNDVMNKARQEPSRDSRRAYMPPSDADRRPNSDGPQMTDKQVEEAPNAKSTQHEDMKADVAKIKQLLGKKPGERVAPRELFDKAKNSPEIAQILSKYPKQKVGQSVS